MTHVSESIDELRSAFDSYSLSNSLIQWGMAVTRQMLNTLEVERPDSPLFLHISPEGTNPENWGEAHATTSLPELKAMADVGGLIDMVLGQQWAVLGYATWEERVRPALIEKLGGDMNIPLFGDLKFLRNDIVHHRGIASKNNSGRLKVLNHWVTIGSPIRISLNEMKEFSALVPWDELTSSAR